MIKPETYPFTAIALTRNFNLRKVTITEPYSRSFNSNSGRTAKGVYYRYADLFDTAAKAVKAGRNELRRRQKYNDRAQEAIVKDTAALDKVEAAIAAKAPKKGSK